MKYFNQILTGLIFIVLSLTSVQAQDLHYTMYDRSPLLVNPANTGAFLGAARISSIYRSQWNGTYKTPSVSADLRIISIGKKKKDWIGGGLFYLNDRVGDFDLKTVYTLLSGTYHKVLDKELKNVLTLGVQFGSILRSSRGQFTLITPEEIEGNLSNTGSPDSLRQSNTYYTALKSWQSNIGIRFRSQLNENAKLVVGGAVFNPFQFDRSIGYKRPSIMKIHASLEYTLNDKFRLRPSTFFQTTAGLTEIVVQTELGYYATDNKKVILNGGLGYRFGDALQFLAGLDYKDWRLSVSYDMSLTPLAQQSRYKNGFEIGLSYIIVLPSF